MYLNKNVIIFMGEVFVKNNVNMMKFLFVLLLLHTSTATATSELLSSFYHGPLLVSIPTILLVTFVAVPLVYAFLNHLSSPELTSMDNLYDEYSLHHPWPLNKNVFKDDGNEHLKRYGQKGINTLLCMALQNISC